MKAQGNVMLNWVTLHLHHQQISIFISMKNSNISETDILYEAQDTFNLFCKVNVCY